MTKNLSPLGLLIPLVAVGQIAQTICVPALEHIAQEMQVATGSVQAIMAAYLVTYGLSQLLYGPLSDHFGRRPFTLIGLLIFLLGTGLALNATHLTDLIIANTLQGCGTGVAGVMMRTIPRDIYTGDRLRIANSRIGMGIIVSPMLAPLFGGVLTSLYGWRACYLFLLFLGSCVWLCMLWLLPETHTTRSPADPWHLSYRNLLSNVQLLSYCIILACSAAGLVLFEAVAGVLMGNVMGLPASTISILFILPLPAAFIGSWYAGGSGKHPETLTWHAVISYLVASLGMWLPAWCGIMNLWTLLLPAILAFFAVGMLFPLVTTVAMQPFKLLAGSAGAVVGGLQNMGAGIVTCLSALLPQRDQSNLGLLMTITSLIILGSWWRITRSHSAPT